MGRNFVKGRSSSRVCTTEPVFGLVGYRKVGREKVDKVGKGGDTEGMDQFCRMVQRTCGRKGT